MSKYITGLVAGFSVIGAGVLIMNWTNSHGKILENELRDSPSFQSSISEEQKKKQLIMQNIFDNMKSDRPIWDVRWDPNALEKAAEKEKQSNANSSS